VAYLDSDVCVHAGNCYGGVRAEEIVTSCARDGRVDAVAGGCGLAGVSVADCFDAL
jgi:hypothetical protein